MKDRMRGREKERKVKVKVTPCFPLQKEAPEGQQRPPNGCGSDNRTGGSTHLAAPYPLLTAGWREGTPHFGEISTQGRAHHD